MNLDGNATGFCQIPFEIPDEFGLILGSLAPIPCPWVPARFLRPHFVLAFLAAFLEFSIPNGHGTKFE